MNLNSIALKVDFVMIIKSPASEAGGGLDSPIPHVCIDRHNIGIKME